MKQTLLLGTIFSAALAVGVSAQNPPTGSQPPQGTPQTPQSERAGQGKQVTLTGCLTADSSGAAGSTGATGTSGSKGGSYVLTDAKMGGGSASGGAATAGGQAGTSGSSMARVKLEGGNQSDMQKYANSQVEVRGTMSGAGAMASPGATGGEKPSAGAGSDQTLRVSSVRQVSASCSGK